MWDYFTMKGDVVKPDPNWEEDEIFYCSICDLEWLNNCLGKRYYNTFILLMVFVLLVVMLVWLAGYVSAAMGKFFLFYLVLIKKVVPKYLQRMKTYDYILATGGGNRFTEVDPSDELDSSSDEI
ncbi:unnamed protein product [Brassica rapa subsp. narinosa]